jgi:DNA polymerase-4/protein ImuB
MKILCVLLPHFPLRCELIRHPALIEQPVMVTYTVGSEKLILDFSPELQGIQRDMPLQQALSIHGDMELLHADVLHYWLVFNKLLDALEKKSPLVEGTELGNIYIGLDGLHLLYPDDTDLVSAALEALPAIFDVHLGIAEGKFPAYLAALHSPSGGYKVFIGDIALYLKDLSCDLLPISLKSKERLHTFGLHTLGQVTELSPGPLQAQFGTEGKRLWELANGIDETPFYPRMTEEIIEESTTLSSITTSLDVMLVAIEVMLSRAFVRFDSKGMGIRRINLWTRSWLAEHWEHNINFKEPAMTTKSALSRIKQVMENTPQPGPVEQLGMKITGLGRQHGKQKSLFTEVRAKDHLMDDIKQLEFRLGGPQLYRMMEVEPWSRIPERRYALKPLSQ